MDKELRGLQDSMELYERQRWRDSLPLVLQGMVSVYGGFYGDKLSQDSPKEVWEGASEVWNFPDNRPTV